MKNSISQLDKAYEICRKETQKWAKTFYLGTLLLPQEKRKAIWAIYVWCRRTDEIMDSAEASTKSQDELSDNLNEWEENTKNVFKGNIKSELDSVLLDTIEKYPQSIQPYLDLSLIHISEPTRLAEISYAWSSWEIEFFKKF